MKILHWNCQGLGSPLTIPHLQDIRKVYKPEIIILIETKHADNFVQKVVKDLGYENSFVVSAKGSSGGLVIMWNKVVKVNFFGNPSLNNTDMYIEDGSNVFCLTYIYGHPVMKNRHEMWERLICNAAVGLYQNRPRLMLGDFNDIKDNNTEAELSLQYRLEEEYWRTKSRIQWLQAGDRNTRFFHSKTKQRRSYNRIIHISDEEGKIYTEIKDVHFQIQKYFQDLYRSEGISISQHLLNGIPTTITAEINDKLTQEVTDKEIEDAAHTINPDKSPGPDGMNAGFFRHHWETIKQVMKQMGFCETWCKWIHTCVSTVTFSVLVNGEPSKPITPTRGIRQEEECQTLMNTLREYQRASGQAVNFNKSAITFAKVQGGKGNMGVGSYKIWQRRRSAAPISSKCKGAYFVG
ncbi:PREDICTED: uncharacterized protein LOC106335920 isoform X2 [Brassica oleracea var. oleracea]|uniref:uncharacterized protein LOC106335920 isoform X2 n=1 Tax=Brassica oleracea var. oleracea TaxID=109376 RepID=UPI0006A6B5A6|nr:PREDICTED: uncharacterized protein LOC106335920 isoform X2 [Brassica oleracea var. oleracea]